MAEAALFSIASKLLSTIASPAFKKAYERVQSIRGATGDLEKLGETITSIQAVLLDAERKHNDSAAVKNWIRRVRNVMYDAEDLFDAVVTNDLLKQQRRKGKKHSDSVRNFFSKQNPILFKDFISGKVKAIREDLSRIYQDMSQFGLIASFESENLSISGFRRGVETGSFVNSEDIIGRDDEKKRVVEFLYNEAYANRTVSLISIVGIGGMGKSALAQLVYSDDKIISGFKNRYWACISDIFDEKEVLGKIYQSVIGGNYQDLSLDRVQSSIRNSIQTNGRFLLVLDDLWDEDTSRGSKLRSILSNDNAEGSKIIITTRNLSVARAMGADVVLELHGLSKDASWALFKRYAFTKDQENDPTWINVGEKIASKCSDVPLAIKSIASLLRTKDTIGEWRSLENEQLSMIQLSNNPIMDALRLSYDHLPPYLKNCFAYCSVFPKDSWLRKDDLIYFWIGQGYIMPKEGETLMRAGDACFMELFRRCFFQDAEYDDETKTERFKMHDLVHDLAKDVAGEESCIITPQGKGRSHNKIRHLCVDYESESHKFHELNPLILLDADRLRTSFYTSLSCRPELLDEQFKNFKFLRALSLRWQGIGVVPSSIGGLQYLRYLDLSSNFITHLPDSITKLVNLISLDISKNIYIWRLPRDIGELVSLIYRLCLVPSALVQLTGLEHLSEFNVDRDSIVGLDKLGRLNIRKSLKILFEIRTKWSRDEVLLERGHVPDSLEELEVRNYPSMRMGAWWRDINPASSMLPKLEHLCIEDAEHVKHLPPLRCLPFLRSLRLYNLRSLEYIEDDEVVPCTTPFFPSLCTLELWRNDNLKGWSRPAILSAAPNAFLFQCLSKLSIVFCNDLTSLAISAPRLKSINLVSQPGDVLASLVSSPFASSIEEIRILGAWYKLRGITEDWAFLPNIRLLTLDGWQEDALPECLQQLVSLGKLDVKYVYL